MAQPLTEVFNRDHLEQLGQFFLQLGIGQDFLLPPAIQDLILYPDQIFFIVSGETSRWRDPGLQGMTAKD